MSRVKELESMVSALELKLHKEEKICRVLMDRVENSIALTGSSYTLFENNILLHKKVEQRTEELKRLLAEMEMANERLLHEIEERKKAEERYRDIFEHSVTGMYQVSYTGRFVTLNASIANILGTSPTKSC